MNWKLILNENDEPKWFPGETDTDEGELMDNYLIRCLDQDEKKRLTKLLASESAILIRTNFLNIIDGTY